MAQCAWGNPYYDPGKAHHTPSGFRNNYIEAVAKPLPDLLRWKWEAMRADVPKPPAAPTPVVAPDLARIRGYHRGAGASGVVSPAALTWIGHATLLVQANGLNVLTDPMFSERASPVQIVGPKRAQAPGVALEDLPPIDVVIVSHNHYDHLDRASVAAIDLKSKQDGHTTLFLVPLGLKPWFVRAGITNVVELDWWQHHVVHGVEFHLTPVQHWSARSLGDQSQTLWGGWAVLGAELHWYFGGDAGYSQDFADTRQHFAPHHGAATGGGFDLALLPIGGYEPRWFMRPQHINPNEALQAHLDLGAKHSVAMHWGTFALTDESLDQAPKDLALAKAARGVDNDAFIVMKIGETRPLPARK
ncbi:MAG: MBL fold metallo-hydrolase [Rhodoferax sp.]|nr:MBL fold metallo-hydrolase [Rhodoferax sp.]MBK9235536.1 MBL fold metallo-hydrolase [Rhodoferax sp.]